MLAYGTYLQLFVRARWLMVASASLGTCFFQFFLAWHFPFHWIYTVVAVVALYNFALWRHIRKHPFPNELSCPMPLWRSEVAQHRRIALLQIVADLIALFFLLHFTGGIENPFVALFLLHVAAGAILLEPAAAIAVAVLAALLIFFLATLEKLGVLFHYHHVAVFGDFEPMDSWVFVLGLPLIYAFIIGCFTAVLIFVANEMNRKRDAILAHSKALEQRNERLTALDQKRLRTMAVVSHDLKSPIAAVLAYLAALKGGYLGEVTAQQREVVQKSILRLERLGDFIRDVLAWQTLETGELRQNLQPIDLAPILQQSVADYSETAQSRDITLLLDAPESLPLVLAAPMRMAQVFDNLISNAVKYTLSGGRVDVSAAPSADASTLQVRVCDTGVGMSDEEMSHLFEDFYRAPTVRAKFEGTGLGLSVAQQIVLAHRGEIDVTSQPGEGACFTVLLPLLR